MALDHAWIAAHIPHQAQMCLLEEVLSHSAEEILCRAVSHRSPGNPLRTGNRLHALCAIEYAAQAAAIHGALYSEQPANAPPFGMLASVRDVRLALQRLDRVDGDLLVNVRTAGADENIRMFEFIVSHDSKPLVSGRGSIALRHRESR